MNTSTRGKKPATAEWNTKTNWDPAVVPTNTATFGSAKDRRTRCSRWARSSKTEITFSSSGATVEKIEFADGAPSYTFRFSSPAPSTPALTIAGEGIANSSTHSQSFVIASSSAAYWNPQLKFTSSATAGGPGMLYSAGPATPKSAGGGVIGFCDTSSAGSASFTTTTGAKKPKEKSTVGGEVSFSDSSSAGTAHFTNHGTLGTDGETFGNTVFHDTSTADHATFTSVGGTVSDGDGGNTQFFDTSTAAYGVFNNLGGTHKKANGGDVAFDGTANGGHGYFYNHAATVAEAHGGLTSFNNNPPALTQGASAGHGVYYNYGARKSGEGGGGHTEFTAKHGSPTAGNGTFINHGSAIAGSSSAGHTIFSINLPTHHFPTAGNGTFWNHPAVVGGAAAGFTEFSVYPPSKSKGKGKGSGKGNGTASSGRNVPTAGDGTFHNLGGYTSGAAGGYTSFKKTTSAGHAQLIAYGGTNGGEGGCTSFGDMSSAGNAQLIAYGSTSGGESGRIAFYDESSGGAANFQLFGNGVLDIGDHTKGLTIGVLALTGGIISTQLGSNLTGLNLSEGLIVSSAHTTFSFWKEDGGGFAFNTPYTILTAPNLSSFTGAQFSGNSLDEGQPTFTIVGNNLQVCFNQE